MKDKIALLGKHKMIIITGCIIMFIIGCIVIFGKKISNIDEQSLSQKQNVTDDLEEEKSKEKEVVKAKANKQIVVSGVKFSLPEDFGVIKQQDNKYWYTNAKTGDLITLIIADNKEDVKTSMAGLREFVEKKYPDNFGAENHVVNDKSYEIYDTEDKTGTKTKVVIGANTNKKIVLLFNQSDTSGVDIKDILDEMSF